MQERESNISKREVNFNVNFQRIIFLENQYQHLKTELLAQQTLGQVYHQGNSHQHIGHSSQGNILNSNYYRSGLQTPQRGGSIEMMGIQRPPMAPSGARTRVPSKPPSRNQEYFQMPKNLMQSRAAGMENIPKNMRRPPPMMPHHMKPQMIDLRDEPEHQKLGKRVIHAEDVENIEDESPVQYQRSQKTLKR